MKTINSIFKYLKITKHNIKNDILSFYLGSNDFNGIMATTLAAKYCPEIPIVENKEDFYDLGEGNKVFFSAQTKADVNSRNYIKLIKILKNLLSEGCISVVYDVNPHIKRYPEWPLEDQIKQLQENFDEIGLYPTKKVIEPNISKEHFFDFPFKRRLLLGEPQVYPPFFFELQVLEPYSNDPRFIFDFRDYTGRISIADEHYENEETLNRDKVFMQNFGIGYRKSDFKRVAVAWPCDLAMLSSEHQKRWETFSLSEECIIDPDLYENQIKGNWAEGVSIYMSFLKEIEIINLFCEKIGWKNLFLKSYQDGDRPAHFRMPFHSTSEQYYKFVGILDKLLSENINKEFFDDHLSSEEKIETYRHSKTGMDSVKDLGTVKLLEVWLYKTMKFPDGNKPEFIFRTLKKIRKHRSKEAHKIQENLHGIEYDKMHDTIIEEAYTAIRSIRLLLTNHPMIKDMARELVPDWLFTGKIKTFSFYKNSK